jgi:hypothetical protein
MTGDWYFNESDWHPREREIPVFFKANKWVEGEIQTCYSGKTTTPQEPDAEVKVISCSFEENEPHVIRVKFLGPIKADSDKEWKCERLQTTIGCRLQ